MIFESLRWRLQVWHGLILVLVLGAFGFTAYRVASDDQLRRIDQDLEHRLGTLFFRQPPPRPEHNSEPPPGPPPEEFRRNRRPDLVEFIERLKDTVAHAGVNDSSQTNGFYYALWQDGTLLAKSDNAPAQLLQPRLDRNSNSDLTNSTRTSTGGGRNNLPPPPPPQTRGGVREMYRFFPHGECVLAGHFMAPEFAAMRRLALMLILAGTSVLLLGLAGGWWVSTQAIRPIDKISATATKISAGDLSQRINSTGMTTELRLLVTVLNSTFSRLEAAFANQARFTADASHELRTPVAVILAQAQSALSRGRSAPEYREALEACQRAAQRMRHLTESLLQLARLDAGQEELQRSPFDLATVTAECVQLLRPLAAERNIQLVCEITPARCVGDPQRVAQVATNLLTNAIQFTRERSEVRITAQSQNGSAVLMVADTGPGIPQEDLAHIFERFYRVDKSRSRVQGRNGLGLAISKAIVDAHGGTIQVTSTVGSGSVFTVKLPSGTT
jgi:signal transduction histidine kinase